MPERDVTIPDPGDDFLAPIRVEAIRAYSVGRLWVDVPGVELRPGDHPDDGRRVRVASVKVDGVWVEL